MAEQTTGESEVETKLKTGATPENGEENKEETLGTEEETSNVEDLESKRDEENKKEEKVEVDFKEKFYYLAAEMENMKRRVERDKTNIVKFGLESVLKDLVEVVDNLDRSIEAVSITDSSDSGDEKIKNIVSGIEMVRTQFLDVLKKQGLEQIESLDKEFDPNFHEAMAQQESKDHKEGYVVQEFQKGYMLNGRLLRASKVIVSK
ncbi:nucleotide exchange factor GrpE [bacterium]|nr:nucleotide exchange factor GrpE [bacterium]